jgi:quercetin dioxygenase-like cupin family protein
MEKKSYQIIDCLTSIDLRKNQVVPGARTRVGGSHDGKQDLGHVCKSIFEYDNCGFLWVIQEAGVSSPYDNYVYHPDVDELEYVISGTCEFSCPNLPSTQLGPGDFFSPLDSLPHENTHDGLDQLNLLVYYPRRISDCGRIEFGLNEKYEGNGTCPIVRSYSEEPEEISPGRFRVIGCEGRVTCSSYQFLKPGVAIPQTDFVSHDTDEIIFILEGTGIATYPDKTYVLRPQLAIFNPAGTPHRLYNNSDGDLKMVVYYTTGKFSDVKDTVIQFPVD